MELLNVVFENEELLVVHKPAGLVCHPTRGDEYSSLVGRVRLYLGPNSVAHLINRLDRETSGIVLLAKTETASRGIKKLFERREVSKTYLAIVHGVFPLEPADLNASIGRDEQSPVWSKDRVRGDGSSAQTAFQRLHFFQREREFFSLVEARPLTGRKHQIRIHLSHLGFSIVGDKIYGRTEQFYLHLIAGTLNDEHWAELKLTHHALHAERIEFVWRLQRWSFWSPPEEPFLAFLDENGRELAMKREKR